MSKPILKIFFSDFWKGFNIHDNYFTSNLSSRFELEITPNADILIHSVYGLNYLAFNKLRICFTGENKRPDYSKSDFHIGFDHSDDPRYFRWPVFLLYGSPGRLIKNTNPEEIIREKKHFCNMIVSNPKEKRRIEFFHQLSRYKPVDSGGKLLNNIGGPVLNKLDFVKNYKFSIAFENNSYPGYTTEKIYESMSQNSIPIYWGNPEIHRDFNTKSFINLNDFNSFDEAIGQIKEIDQNENLYRKILDEPYWNDNKVPEKFNSVHFLNFLENIIAQKNNIVPVAKRSQWIYANYWRLKKKVQRLIK